MELFVRIRNQRELEKFRKVGMTQEDCGLARKILVTNGETFNSELLKALECQEETNLLAIQFQTHAQKELLTFEKAKELINLQREVKNKILLIPIEASVDDFKKLQSEFSDQEEYVISLFPEMEDEVIIGILDFCKGNSKIKGVEFIERDKSEYIEKIFRFGLMYSNFFTMGLTNIRLNGNMKYGGTTPEVFYSAAGFKYFSKQVFLHAGPPSEFKKFSPKTLKYTTLSQTEEADLKMHYGNQWKEALYCQNFLNVHKALRSFSSMSKEEISKELTKKGINLSFTEKS